MKEYDFDSLFTTPVIDVEATSHKLKRLRTERNVTVADLQKIFLMENPQSIYNWENPGKKFLPRLENLITLAKFYKVRIDDLIVIRTKKGRHARRL